MPDSGISCRKDSGNVMKKGAERRVLIAIDLSENSLKAVDYAGTVMACHSEVYITLLHVIKEPAADIMPKPEERHEHVERVRSKSLSIMEEAGRRLTSKGFAEHSIHLKIQICRNPVSVAELILREQQKGGYGTIVVGRRGLSKREEFLFGSVSNTIVREAKGCTVWVVA